MRHKIATIGLRLYFWGAKLKGKDGGPNSQRTLNVCLWYIRRWANHHGLDFEEAVEESKK